MFGEEYAETSGRSLLDSIATEDCPA